MYGCQGISSPSQYGYLCGHRASGFMYYLHLLGYGRSLAGYMYGSITCIPKIKIFLEETFRYPGAGVSFYDFLTEGRMVRL